METLCFTKLNIAFEWKSSVLLGNALFFREAQEHLQKNKYVCMYVYIYIWQRLIDSKSHRACRKKSKMWPCPDPPWTDLKIESFYGESLLLICTSPLEEGSGTVEGQRAPCREAGEAQRGPESPESLESPKNIDFTCTFAELSLGQGFLSIQGCRKASPPPILGICKKMWRIYAFNAMGPQNIDFLPTNSINLSKGLRRNHF